MKRRKHNPALSYRPRDPVVTERMMVENSLRSLWENDSKKIVSILFGDPKADASPQEQADQAVDNQ